MKPEQQIQNAILGWLAAEHILAFRNNSGAMKLENRFVRFGVPGMADIVAYPYAAVVWIECKSSTGKQSELQRSFQRQVEAVGHGYVLARSVDDVEEALKRFKSNSTKEDT